MQPLGKTVRKILRKTKDRAITRSSNCTPAYTSEGNKNKNLKRYMHPKVHSNCMNKSQHTEATRVSVGRKMDKGGTMYKHDGIMLSRAEE